MQRLIFSREAAADIKAAYFEVFYEFDASRVVVHLVFHTSQDPVKWRERLGLR